MRNTHRTIRYAAFLAALAALCFALTGCLVRKDSKTDAQPTSTAPVLPFNQETEAPVQPTDGGISMGIATAPIQVVTPQATATPPIVVGTPGWTGAPAVTPTPTPAPTPTPSPTPTENPSLRNGSSGDEVRALQRALKDLGYYTGSVDGDFGEGTESAVRAFQKANGLYVDGVAGPRTMSVINGGNAKHAPTATPKPKATATPKPTVTPKATSRATPRTYVPSAPDTYRYLQMGSSGSDVRKLQQRLSDLGYYTGQVNGRFGEETERAVYEFQQRNGLWIDGVAGEDTQRMLYSDDALEK